MSKPCWIDTHCHLDAPEFAEDLAQVRQRAREAGVGMLLLPAVSLPHFEAVRALAHRHGDAYALGVHPLYVAEQPAQGLAAMDQAIVAALDDPRLVAVGEIGLDYFVEGLDPVMQSRWYEGQLDIAQAAGLPVILHVRRSADALLKQLRRRPGLGGIAHAFNGSLQQAQAFIDLGFKLGFGGAMTFERALQIRRLAEQLPAEALVLETDAPDIPPQWLYQTAEARARGQRSRNQPAELPRIAQTLSDLRGVSLEALAQQTSANACAALPRLAALMQTTPSVWP